MPQSECIRVRLKPGMTDKFVQWARQIPNRLDEVKASMNAQGVLEQSIFLDHSPNGDFIVIYWEVEDLARARAAFQKSTRQVDLEMTEMIEATWDRSEVSRLESIIEL